MAKSQAQIDRRIDTLQLEAKKLWPKLERMLDELKALGPHSVSGTAPLDSTRQWLADLSKR